jgi:hypothetical protein
MNFLLIFLISLLFSGCSNLTFQEQSQDLNFDEHGLPLTKISINENDFQAFIDSGGQFDVVMPLKVIKDLNLKETNITSKSSGCDGEIQYLKNFQGNLALTGSERIVVEISEFKDWSYNAGDNPPIITNGKKAMEPIFIGLNVLRNFNVLINFKDKKIAFFPHSQILPPEADKKWNKSNFSITPEGLEMTVKSGETQFRAVLDTGANKSVFIKSDQKEEKAAINTALDIFTLHNILIGNLEVGQIELVALPLKYPKVNLILGCDFLINYVVFIDFSNRIIWFSESINFTPTQRLNSLMGK